MREVVVCVVTAPDEETARRIAHQLVEDRLAACVNVVADVRSIYRWEGRICEDPEAILWIKTKRRLVQFVLEKIKGLHPYEVPEILFLPVEEGLAEYLQWVVSETHSPKGGSRG